MKKIKLRRSKREMKREEKEKQKRRKKKGTLTKVQKEEKKDEITSQKKWVENATTEELVEWLEKRYYNSIVRQLEKSFVEKRSVSEIIAFLEERYASSRALPVVEAIFKLCKSYKLLQIKLKEMEGKSNETKVHPVRIGRIQRNVVREHRQHRTINPTKTGKADPEKRSIQRVKRGS